MTLTADEYIESLFAADPALERVKAALTEHGMPQISVAPGYGRLLTLLVQTSGAQQILEIGALGGYSGICLAHGLSAGGKLTSLELKPEYAEVARTNLTAAGLGDRVQYMVGHALASLDLLEREGARYDFFFIDADKLNYPHYLERTLRLANPGALIVGDNCLRHGKAFEPADQTDDVVAMRRFNERLVSDPRLQGLILPAYDGLAIARVR